MELEKTFEGITVVVKGTAVNELVSIGSYEYQSEYEARWIDGPEITDSFDKDYNDVFLFPHQREEILSGLNIHDFVI